MITASLILAGGEVKTGRAHAKWEKDFAGHFLPISRWPTIQFQG